MAVLEWWYRLRGKHTLPQSPTRLPCIGTLGD